MKGAIALLFLLSVALSLKALTTNHEAAFTFETWVNPNSKNYTCACLIGFIWPRTMSDCTTCGGIVVCSSVTDGVSRCNMDRHGDMTCCWLTS